MVRGEAVADEGDQARERYMASWVRAAVAGAGERPVLVVTGGFHRPALRTLVEAGGPKAEGGWPDVPAPPDGAIGGSFLVPYSFRQLDAFAGYQSGMPSPAYYQRLWEAGPRAAGQDLVRAVVERLRARNHPVSTAALIAAHSTASGLAALRGHPLPTRLDLLDGLAGTLVTDALDEPLPWTRRGPLSEGAHPVVVEMVAACSGDRVGRLHPDTPVPPLVHDVAARLTALGLDGARTVTLRLTDPADLTRSQVLHRLRVLRIPGFARVSGPADGTDPVFTERWEPAAGTGREAASGRVGHARRRPAGQPGRGPPPERVRPGYGRRAGPRPDGGPDRRGGDRARPGSAAGHAAPPRPDRGRAPGGPAHGRHRGRLVLPGGRGRPGSAAPA
ncbi:DUF5682 family protein [Streptomyces sp. NPDC003035]|uniref:DUF5682 family protein n=1 Tax=Streptomyces sp. NPDC003035 TaxID=3364676 RepID=UPI0036ACF35B